MVFDDIFYILNYTEEKILSKSVLELNQYLKDISHDSKAALLLYEDFPYVLIPEMMYHDGENKILINQKYPHLLPASSAVKVDTWPIHYLKCIYYIPKDRIGHRDQVFHLYTAFAKWSEAFFDKHSHGVWAFKHQNKMIVFLRLTNILKEVQSFEVRSPDETGFHLLKMLEPYKEFQNEMTLWTNENDPYYLQIMAKYIPNIKVEKNDLMFLIKNILASACASLQEI